MFRRLPLLAAIAVLPAGLALAAGGFAAASTADATPASCPGVIQITRLAWSPPQVSPGQMSTATVMARNCTGQAQQTSVIWFEHFIGSGTGIPPGCPAIDPLPPQPANFAPFGRFTTSSGTLVPPSCTATKLEVTFNFDRSGVVIAQKTADLLIIAAPAAG
jgi:hypothetical protein